MESRLAALTANIDQDFNTVSFEKKLLQLKDSQESINTLSAWCLENRQHHKKIVSAWLNVLKKGKRVNRTTFPRQTTAFACFFRFSFSRLTVKVEQRLNLFYLANDVIQYSKRKNYDFVASWGTTLQKATTMVRYVQVAHVTAATAHLTTFFLQRGKGQKQNLKDLQNMGKPGDLRRRVHNRPVRADKRVHSESQTRFGAAGIPNQLFDPEDTVVRQTGGEHRPQAQSSQGKQSEDHRFRHAAHVFKR